MIYAFDRCFFIKNSDEKSAKKVLGERLYTNKRIKLDFSYAVDADVRGLHIGEKLVSDCLVQAKAYDYLVLQFNAVVATNVHARHLYERLGFTQLGTIPGGFRMKDGHYEDICPYYFDLRELGR